MLVLVLCVLVRAGVVWVAGVGLIGLVSCLLLPSGLLGWLVIALGVLLGRLVVGVAVLLVAEGGLIVEFAVLLLVIQGRLIALIVQGAIGLAC